MGYVFSVVQSYHGRRVCLPDRIVDLNENTKKKDLEYLYKRGYEGVVREKKEDTEGAED